MSLFNIFKSKETIDIDPKIESMSVEQYNKYIEKVEEEHFQYLKSKYSNIIDKAYKDYIKQCKIKSKYIDNIFSILEGDYGCEFKEMVKFIKETKIKNYLVEYRYPEGGCPFLLIKVLKE